MKTLPGKSENEGWADGYFETETQRDKNKNGIKFCVYSSDVCLSK